jgi:TatD DNase family protein
MFDSHAHYDDRKFEGDRESLLRSLLFRGVTGVVNAGCDVPSSYRSLELAQKYSYMYATAGIHPNDALKAEKGYLNSLEKLLKEEKVVAVGEIGLDYHWDTVPKDVQRKFFREQLELALSLDKPVVIHARESVGECAETVLEYKGLRGIFHSYSGSVETMKQLQKHGWYMSFSGPCTFSNASKLREVVANCDINLMLTETDAPYLTPHPYRGERNDSTYIKYVINKIAELKNMNPVDVEKITTENACRIYGISI